MRTPAERPQTIHAIAVLLLIGVLFSCSEAHEAGDERADLGAHASETTSADTRTSTTARSTARPPACRSGIVAVIGDSITETVQRQLRDGALGRPVVVRAEGGASVRDLADEAAKVAELDPSQVIVNLGTNDVLEGAKPAQTAAALRELVEAFDASTCVHVTTINEGMVNIYGRLTSARAQATNDAIRALAAQEDWEIIPWAAVVREHRQAGSPGGRLTFDTIHPSERRGEARLLEAYGEAVRIRGGRAQ